MVYRLLLHEVGWFGKIEPASLTPGEGGGGGVNGGGRGIIFFFIMRGGGVVGV